jgi:glycosyltransferase involved in cell wall biosynthesis
MRYHKRPAVPATAYDIAAGTVRALALAKRHRIVVVHARSYVAALIALAVKRVTGAKFLFDMRGLWADERVDGGLWPKGGRLYRSAKATEARFLRSADRVVTLTHASASEVGRLVAEAGGSAPATVIPTCADLDLFTISGAAQREPIVLGYVGSVGTWYLLDDMLRFYREIRRRRGDARLLIANRGEHDLIRSRMEALAIDPSAVEIVAADRAAMPGLIARMTAGLALIKPSYSKLASAPTKLAEYLGCGIPCVGNAGVGDMEKLLEGRRIGICLKDLTDRDLSGSADRLLSLLEEPDLQQRCRRAAEELFSLDSGVAAYAAIYDELSGR